MNRFRSSRASLVSLLVLAWGCSSEAMVATSDEGLAATTEPVSGSPPMATPAAYPPVPLATPRTTAPVPRHNTTFSGDPKQHFGGMQFIAGDLDGDGFDDMVLVATRWIDADTLGPDAEKTNPEAWERYVVAGDSSAYVFYGRPDFPEHLTLNDADAIISGAVLTAQPLGDVNGDGLADLALQTLRTVGIAFGSPARWSGDVPETTLGVHWRGGPLPPTVTEQSIPLLDIWPAGDVDADGCDDLLLTMASAFFQTTKLGPIPNSLVVESFLTQRSFLVSGRRDAWNEGQFDPSWAVAEFQPPTSPSTAGSTPGLIPANPRAAGDLDGDGYADLFADSRTNDWTTQLIFYGGPGKLSGTLGPAQADARTSPPEANSEFGNYFSPIGDLDGDGRTELAHFRANGMHIYYGRSARWSGALPSIGDLVIKTDVPLNEQAVWAADIDGDARPELVLAGQPVIEHGPGTVYVMRGGEGRLLGSATLTKDQIVAGGARAQSADDDVYMFGVHARGDVNGDGNADILAGGPGWDPSVSHGYVLLIPSSLGTPQ